MKQRVRNCGVAIAVALVVGCNGTIAEPADGAERPQGLTFDDYSGAYLAGAYVAGDTVVTFEVREDEGVVTGSIGVGARTFAFDIDHNQGVATFDALSEQLAPDELGVVELAAYEIEAAIPADEGTRTHVEHAAVQMTAFLAVAPADTPLVPLVGVNQRGITCLQYCYCSWEYIGNGYYRHAGKGGWCTGGSGNGCKGRCGVGCGSNMSGNYTRDCARHDYQLTGWSTAFDDYTWGGCWCS